MNERAAKGRPAVTAEGIARAKQLKDEGWQQVSRKYRSLARVPGGVSAKQWMVDHDPDRYMLLVQDAYKELERKLEEACRCRIPVNALEHIELSAEDFEAWLQVKREAEQKAFEQWAADQKARREEREQAKQREYEEALKGFANCVEVTSVPVEIPGPAPADLGEL